MTALVRKFGLFYLGSAVTMSERETGDPLLDVLPITPGEVMRVKFLLAFVFVVVGWLNMAVFTVLQGLPPQMAGNVLKLNTLGSIYTLLLVGLFQLGIQFFGWSLFHKAIILYSIVSSVFSILFFIGITERGNNHPDHFPLVPFLESLPVGVTVIAAVGAGLAYYFLLREGPWNQYSSNGS